MKESMFSSATSSSGHYFPPCRKGPYCSILRFEGSSQETPQLPENGKQMSSTASSIINTGNQRGASSQDVSTGDKTELTDTVFLAFGGQVSLTGMRNDTWFYQLEGENSAEDDSHTNWRRLNPGMADERVVAPVQRWKGSMVTTSDSKTAVLFGGSNAVGLEPNGDPKEVYFNDVWRFDTDSFAWAEDATTNRPPGRRAHTAALFGDNEMLIFAGKGSDGKVRRDLWLYDLKTKSFTDLSDTASFPGPPRKGHSAVSYFDSKNDEDVMIIYGGRIDDFHYLGEVYKLTRPKDGSNDDLKWTKLFPSASEAKKMKDPLKSEALGIPGPRNHHSAVYYDHKMYVYGGRSSYSSTKTHDKIWRFDLEENKWDYLDIDKLKAAHLRTNFNQIPSRMEHCADVFDDQMIVFAGQDASGNRRNDLAILNLSEINQFMDASNVDEASSDDTLIKIWKELEPDNCSAKDLGDDLKYAFYIGLVVIAIGFFLIYLRYRQSTRYLGYRQLG